MLPGVNDLCGICQLGSADSKWPNDLSEHAHSECIRAFNHQTCNMLGQKIAEREFIEELVDRVHIEAIKALRYPLMGHPIGLYLSELGGKNHLIQAILMYSGPVIEACAVGNIKNCQQVLSGLPNNIVRWGDEDYKRIT